MVKFLKVVGWVLLAPLVWIIGNLSFSCAPAASEVEYIVLGPLPQHALTAARVAELNEELKETTSLIWRVDVSLFFCRECMLAVPTEGGGLQLVHVYPALAWRCDTPETDWQTVMQGWLAECEEKEGSGK